MKNAPALVLSCILASTTAWAEDMTKAMAACEASNKCGFSPPDAEGVRVFKIRMPGKTTSMRCTPDGLCTQMLPKRGSVPVANLTTLLAVK